MKLEFKDMNLQLNTCSKNRHTELENVTSTKVCQKPYPSLPSFRRLKRVPIFIPNFSTKVMLNPDPYKWTKRQAQNWLCWLREANDLEELDITEFNVDGPGLCSLSPQLVSEGFLCFLSW